MVQSFMIEDEEFLIIPKKFLKKKQKKKKPKQEQQRTFFDVPLRKGPLLSKKEKKQLKKFGKRAFVEGKKFGRKAVVQGFKAKELIGQFVRKRKRIY